MKQVLLVTATKTKTLEEFKQRPLAPSLQVLVDKRYDDSMFDFEVVKDNKDGLPKVYNRYITEKNKDKLLLFVHDDLEIHDLNLVEKLNKSPYDITGIAGGSTFEMKDNILWHICSKRESQSGFVTHPLCWQENNELKVDYNSRATAVFGPAPRRVLILDALFMCLNVERALEAGFQFDERFNFHHWDISSCLIANEKKLKMGTSPIYCVHYGLGNSFMSPEWEESNKLFKKYWQTALKRSE